MPLSFAPKGVPLRVLGLYCGRGLARRLMNMGIIPGRLLRVIKSGGPGPLIIELLTGLQGNPRFALSFGIASKIMVEVVSYEGSTS